MNPVLLEKLKPITPEERDILAGGRVIDRSLYYSDEKSTEIDSARVLKNGKLIDFRPHTRFVHFPKHTGEDDIAVNFMILPQFFDEAFRMIGAEDNALRDFIISCLTEDDLQSNYLYFHANGIVPVQNLLENIIWNLLEEEPNRRSMNQITMGLLFLSLINHASELRISDRSFDRQITMELLREIDANYRSASLSSFAASRKMDVYTLSRILKKQTGKTFKQLLEEKRLNQACFLLSNTRLTVDEIARNTAARPGSSGSRRQPEVPEHRRNTEDRRGPYFALT